MIKKIGAVILAALSKPQAQDALIKFLKTEAVEKLVVSTLKISGIKAWLITLVAEKVIDEADTLVIEPIFREVGFQGDVLDGAIVYRKVTDAETTQAWLDAVGDV